MPNESFGIGNKSMKVNSNPGLRNYFNYNLRHVLVTLLARDLIKSHLYCFTRSVNHEYF